MLRNWWALASRIGGVEVRRLVVNGQPGAELRDERGLLLGVMALEIADARIQAVRSIVNPEKLEHLGPVGNANELIARGRER
jgi:RNA polymerase sigma-70 factor (ECF subfamily)